MTDKLTGAAEVVLVPPKGVLSLALIPVTRLPKPVLGEVLRNIKCTTL